MNLPKTTLPPLERVAIDRGLRLSLRTQRNRARAAGDTELANAISDLLDRAKAMQTDLETIRVLVEPVMLKGLTRLKRWRAAPNLGELITDIFADTIAAELKTRIAAGHDVPQDLVEEFLVQDHKRQD